MMKLLKSISIYSLFSVIGYCLMANAPYARSLNATNKPPISVNKTTKPAPKPAPVKPNTATRPVTKGRSMIRPITYSNQTSRATITFSSADLVYNPSVGNEWSVWIDVNGRKYYRGDQFTVNIGDTIALNAFDDDPSHDDLGTTIITISNSIMNSGQITESVFVKEYHGRGAGKTAEWEFQLTINSL